MGMLKDYKKTEVKFIKAEVITTKFDYSEFEEKEKENLLELEKKALYSGEIIINNIKELAEIFSEAQNVFAKKNKNGIFRKWYEALGFKKDFVYLCLEKKKLSTKYNDEKIFQLPDRSIKTIKKMDEKVENENRISTILKDENTVEKLKEIKKEEKLEKKLEKKEITEDSIDDNQLNIHGKTKKEVEEEKNSTKERNLIENIQLEIKEIERKIMELEIEKEKLKKQLQK